MGADIPWRVHLNSSDDAVSALAIGRTSIDVAAASAEILLGLPPSDYGVPSDVDPRHVFRFSRVVSRPRGKGGGSEVLRAVLDELDRRGLWGVLEASPYPGQDAGELLAFYERHGFLHHRDVRGLMFRPPGRERR